MSIKIKIAHQKQADKPIFLLSTGSIECGKFIYKGRYKKNFKSLFKRILDLAYTKPKNNILDVSTYRYWNALDIYDSYIVKNWQKTITAEKIHKFANETEIYILLENPRHEFKQAVSLKWKKIFKQLDPNNKNTPKNAWEII